MMSHGGHGEARAVDHTGDAAIELDVVEAVLGGFDFERIFLVEVAQFRGVPCDGRARLSSKVILASSATSLPSPVSTQGFDLEQRGVGIDEGAVESLEEWCGMVDRFHR